MGNGVTGVTMDWDFFMYRLIEEMPGERAPLFKTA
jgi:hypothetical protein